MRIIQNPRDAERAARDWMIYFGYQDARMTVVGPDVGVDVESADTVAQVKSGVKRVSRPVVQQIYGVAELEEKEAFLFTVGGVTGEALEWADRAGVVLFQLDLSGQIRPLNRHARSVLDSAEGTLAGWQAVTAELEGRLLNREEASITAEFTAPRGFHGFWGIWIHPDGKIRVTRDLAGSSQRTVTDVREGVEWIASALDALNATYWDSTPMLTESGSTRRFVPRITYPSSPISAPDRQVSVVSTTSTPDRPPLRITASDVYSLLSDPGCERRVFLRARGVAGGDPSALQAMLIEIGLEVEDRHRRLFPDSVDLSDGALDERELATQIAVESGDEVLYQGVLTGRHQTPNGDTVSLIAIPDFMLPANGAHVIRDTKAALRVTPDDRPDIAAQLQFHAYIYEQSFGRPPIRLEVVAGDGTIHEIPCAGHGAVVALIERVVALKVTATQPRCDVKWSFRTSCTYFYDCWAQAVERMQLSTLPWLSRSAVEVLRSDGIETITDLLERHNAESLSDVVVPSGKSRRRIGRRARHIIWSARALASGEPIVHGSPGVPKVNNVVLFDLEGTPSIGGRVGYLYLWGTSVHGSDPLAYDAAFALDSNGVSNRRGWELFLARAGEIIARYGDTPWLHWAVYERTQLRSYIEQYGDPDGIGGHVLDLLVDLLPVLRNSVTLPVHSYSLKAVEQYVGFERSQDEFGGDWSITIWQEAVETATPARRDALLETLALYNREDLEGMAAVYDYLKQI